MTGKYSICFEVEADNQAEAEELAKQIEDKYSMVWNICHIMTDDIPEVEGE